MNESCHWVSTWVFEHPTVKGFFKSLISATYKNRQRGTVRQPRGKKSRRKSNRCLMMNVVEYSTWIQSAESKVPTNIHHCYVPVFVYVCVIQLIWTHVWRRTKRDFIKCKVWLHGDVVHNGFTGTLCACYQILIPNVQLDLFIYQYDCKLIAFWVRCSPGHLITSYSHYLSKLDAGFHQKYSHT